MTYLTNAFSLQMLAEFPRHLHVTEIPEYRFTELAKSAYSVVGHADTARILGVEHRRESITVAPGDHILVAQLQGGRLPEGATELPEGFSFRYLFVEVTQ